MDLVFSISESQKKDLLLLATLTPNDKKARSKSFWEKHFYKKTSAKFSNLKFGFCFLTFPKQFFQKLVTYCESWVNSARKIYHQISAVTSSLRLIAALKVNLFHDTRFFPCTLKASKYQRFSAVFKGYRKKPVSWNELSFPKRSGKNLNFSDLPKVKNLVQWFSLSHIICISIGCYSFKSFIVTRE